MYFTCAIAEDDEEDGSANPQLLACAPTKDKRSGLLGTAGAATVGPATNGVFWGCLLLLVTATLKPLLRRACDGGGGHEGVMGVTR